MSSPCSTKTRETTPALRAGLVGHERHAEHLARDALGLVGALDQLDAAALAAAAGVDLRLDDDRAAQAFGDFAGFGRVERHLALGNRHAVAREDGLGLIFVDFHRCVRG